MIKACFFDVDNTLYDYDAAHRAAQEAVIEETGRDLGLSPEAFTALHGEAYRIQQARTGLQNAGVHDRTIRYQIMLEQLGRPVALAPRMTAVYWAAFLDHMRRTPGADTCMAFLRQAGCLVGIGTNMTADYQYEKLDRLGLLEYVDVMVTSEEAGAEKPGAAFFALCAEKAGCPAGACLFIGDNPVHDVQGARQAGMRPVWFCPDPRRAAPFPGVPRLRSLEEVPALFRTLSREDPA